jgi:hypothetical protein
MKRQCAILNKNCVGTHYTKLLFLHQVGYAVRLGVKRRRTIFHHRVGMVWYR